MLICCHANCFQHFSANFPLLTDFKSSKNGSQNPNWRKPVERYILHLVNWNWTRSNKHGKRWEKNELAMALYSPHFDRNSTGCSPSAILVIVFQSRRFTANSFSDILLKSSPRVLDAGGQRAVGCLSYWSCMSRFK